MGYNPLQVQLTGLAFFRSHLIESDLLVLHDLTQSNEVRSGP